MALVLVVQEDWTRQSKLEPVRGISLTWSGKKGRVFCQLERSFKVLRKQSNGLIIVLAHSKKTYVSDRKRLNFRGTARECLFWGFFSIENSSSSLWSHIPSPCPHPTASCPQWLASRGEVYNCLQTVIQNTFSSSKIFLLVLVMWKHPVEHLNYKWHEAMTISFKCLFFSCRKKGLWFITNYSFSTITSGIKKWFTVHSSLPQ